MAIAERTAERSHGWLPFSLLSRKKAITAEKPQVLTLKMDDVFMPSDIAFTPFGQELYGTLIVKSWASEPKISEDRRAEVILDVRERCRKLNISEAQLPLINERFVNLIKQRNRELADSQEPILSPQK